ncbi:MAG: metallophosphoesterase [Myxococcota bacterium]
MVLLILACAGPSTVASTPIPIETPGPDTDDTDPAVPRPTDPPVHTGPSTDSDAPDSATPVLTADTGPAAGNPTGVSPPTGGPFDDTASTGLSTGPHTGAPADTSVPDSDAPDTDAPDTDAPDTGPPDTRVRFVALGDAGDGSPGQFAVADAIEAVCAQRGCDFALYLGDNLYPAGANSPTAPQFQSAFELPYAALDFPFHVVVGNHDYGNTYDPSLPPNEVAYTFYSQKWSLPALSYVFDRQNVRFIGIDTTAIQFGDGGPQAPLVEAATQTWSGWTLVFGHHPYLSNGAHGNAGAYDGVPATDPIGNGALMQTFFEDSICGAADLYLAGHDHDRQWLEPQCGTELVVSGAGARLRMLYGLNPTLFQASSLGFLYVVIDGDTLTGTFYDDQGVADFERVITRTP